MLIQTCISYKDISYLLKGTVGSQRTNSLFFETNMNRKDIQPVFTLKEDDHIHEGKLYYSLKSIYMEIGDVTEILFANHMFNSYAHWLRITKSSKIKSHVLRWREELETKICAEAIIEMRKMSKVSVSAAKWLAEKGWVSKGKVGTPSKQDVANETKRLAEALDEFDGIAEDIGLTKRH